MKQYILGIITGVSITIALGSVWFVYSLNSKIKIIQQVVTNHAQILQQIIKK